MVMLERLSVCCCSCVLVLVLLRLTVLPAVLVVSEQGSTDTAALLLPFTLYILSNRTIPVLIYN